MNWVHHFQHWIAIHIGIESAGPDKYYNFWSGFGSDIGEVTIITGVILAIRHVNCHQRGCWRLGVHVTARGHKLCKKHIGMSNDELTLNEIHTDHQ